MALKDNATSYCFTLSILVHPATFLVSTGGAAFFRWEQLVYLVLKKNYISEFLFVQDSRFKIQDVLLSYVYHLHQAMKLLICKFPLTQKYKNTKI